MVIKVNSKGEAKLFKYDLNHIETAIYWRKAWKEDFREARKNGHRFYIRHSFFDNGDYPPCAFSEHALLVGKRYDSRTQKPEAFPDCRCCFVEWELPDGF